MRCVYVATVPAAAPELAVGSFTISRLNAAHNTRHVQIYWQVRLSTPAHKLPYILVVSVQCNARNARPMRTFLTQVTQAMYARKVYTRNERS